MRDIASRTKISLTALEALERSEFHRLPGGIFSRAVVRAYATEVGLDPDTTVENFLTHARRYDKEMADRVAAARPAVTRDDQEFLERQRRALRVLQVAAVLLAAGAIALLVWQVRRWWPGTSAETPEPVVTVALPPPPSPSSATTPPPPAEPPVSGQAPVRPAEAVETPPAVAPTGPPAGREPAEPAPASPPPTSPPAVDSATGAAPTAAPLVVELTAVADCQITASRDGGPLESQVLRAGERHRLEVTREVVLTVADAGAVSWTINGKAAQPLGRPGAEVRVRVTPANAAEFLP